MVFQSFNLFRHMTVLENLTLAPLKLKKQQKSQAEKYAMELLAKVGDRTALYGLVTGPFTLASHLRGTDIFLDYIIR